MRASAGGLSDSAPRGLYRSFAIQICRYVHCARDAFDAKKDSLTEKELLMSRPKYGTSGCQRARERITAGVARGATLWLAIGLCVVPMALGPRAVHADKIFFKNGKMIEGIIEEEFPSSIQITIQGRATKVPRSRIERIVRESGAENIEKLIGEAEQQLAAGAIDRAQLRIEEARKFDTGGYKLRLDAVQEKVDRIREQGSSAARRIAAEEVLQHALELLDRIQMQRGVEEMLHALDLDPTYEAAHDLMAKYMRENWTPLPMATDYFCERVDPSLLKANHPVIGLLPQIYEDLVRRLQVAQDPEEIPQLTERLMMISKTFEDYPDWSAKATPVQVALIMMRGDGIILSQVDGALAGKNFEAAMRRLQAWAPPNSGLAAAQLYVRAWIGMGDLDRAKQILAAAVEMQVDAPWVDRTLNSINLFQSMVEASEAGNREAAGVTMDRLFVARNDLLPELFDLVAESKFQFDVQTIAELEGRGDVASAAHLAVGIHEYTTRVEIDNVARQIFARLAPQIAYKLQVAWRADGLDIPLEQKSGDIVREALGGRFNLVFNDESPFTLNIIVNFTTFSTSGSRIQEAAAQPDPYTQDHLEPDDAITGLRIDAYVSHPAEPILFSTAVSDPPLPDSVQRGRLQGDNEVYLDITMLADFNDFLEKDFVLYMPADFGGIGSRLVLSAK